MRTRLARLLSSPALAVALLTLLGLWLRLHRLSDKPFSSVELQEIFNARCAGFMKNLPDAASDLLGFVWHHLVWRWGLDPLELWDRLPSALLGALAVPVAYLWGRELLNRRAGAAAAVLACASVFLVDLAQTARWYSAAAVAGSAATVWLLAALRSGRAAPSAPLQDRLRALAPFWLGASVALACHVMAFLALCVQAAVFVWVLRFEQRRNAADIIRTGLWCALPVAPCALLQLTLVLAFRSKMVYHPKVLLVGQPFGLAAMAKAIPAILSGGWTPFWLAFALLAAVGVWHLCRVRFGSAAVALLAVGVPLGLLALLLSLVGNSAIDMSFLAFVAPAVFACVGAGTDRLQSWAPERTVGAVLFALPLLLFAGTNGWLLQRYYLSPVKPVLGADLRSLADTLRSAQLTADDLLVFRYDEHFTHLAFYGAEELQRPRLLAEQIPDHSRGPLMEYMHRLNGCSDRPRVRPDAVAALADLADDPTPLRGRVFVAVSCPPTFGEYSVEDQAEAAGRSLPDLAAWILSRGGAVSTCEILAGRFKGYAVHPFAGVLLAWRPAAGEAARDVAAELRRIFSALPNTRLRLQEPRE